MHHTTHSPLETEQLAHQIAATLKGGDIVLLHGDLGAGKTTFVKGIAEYFGIKKENVVSPTFTLIQVYDITNHLARSTNQKNIIKQLVHVDTYRLENENDLIEIGIEEYLGDTDTVCLIEWPEKIQNLLKNKKTINISIDHLSDSSRTITVE